jgi:hypothetical protein
MSMRDAVIRWHKPHMNRISHIVIIEKIPINYCRLKYSNFIEADVLLTSGRMLAPPIIRKIPIHDCMFHGDIRVTS